MKLFKNLVPITGVLVLLIGVNAALAEQSYDQLTSVAAWGPASRGLQLGLTEEQSIYEVGKPISVIALVRNNRSNLQIAPLESHMFETVLVDEHGHQIISSKSRASELNTTGGSTTLLKTGDLVKSSLPISWQYNLQRGSYRLNATVDIFEGTSMGTSMSEKKAVYAHLASGTVKIIVR